MRGVLAVSLLLAGTACASAPVAHAFDELPGRIQPGQSVTVTTAGGVPVRGTVTHISPLAIELRSDDGLREIEASRVVRVAHRSRQIGKGLLLGGIGGLLVGVAAGQSGGRSGNPYVDTASASGNVVAGVAIGCAAGAGIGAFIRTDRVVYVAATPRVAASEALIRRSDLVGMVRTWFAHDELRHGH